MDEPELVPRVSPVELYQEIYLTLQTLVAIIKPNV